MYGPNTNLGGNSIVSMLEPQARYIRQFVEHAARSRSGLEVRSDVATCFDNELQSRLAGGIWTQCSSWYRDPNGRISTNWPGSVREYHRRTAHFDPADYRAVA